MTAAKRQSRPKNRRKRRRPVARPRVDRPALPRALRVGERPSVDELAAYTIPKFCYAHELSISMFHKMRQLGIGPEVMVVGSRRLISVEAAARWRAEREGP